jgi:hypothetical protein
MRNLIVCCDGTWNTPDQKKGGLPIPTNVVKLFNACVADDAQLKYYHPGVGTEGSAVKRMIGGGLGVGLDKNILSAYHWLCSHYQAGDNIFLFGFSRGAFTARSLGGFILIAGMLDLNGLDSRTAWERISSAYMEGYREKKSITDLHADWPTQVDENGQPPDIHCIGVWDTVGARGVPDDMVLLDQLIDDPRKYSFHNTDLSPRVRHAYHAVALDEVRASFAPTLWTLAQPRPAGSTFEQLWFPGNHGDVGGGHVECGLSDGALVWMCEKAEARGLRLNAQFMKQPKPDFQAVLHDEIDGIWMLMRTLPRAVPRLCPENVGSVLHESAWQRHEDPPISQAPYRRHVAIDAGQSWQGSIYARDHWNDTGLWLEAGVTYQFTSTGEWIDLFNRSGPEGMDDGTFQMGELLYKMGDLIALGEEAFKRITGKQESDWWATRRFESAAWFALVGMIANQPNADGGGTPISGEIFTIGAGVTYTPKDSGYLYCYANDAWRFYRNNRGSVMLTVERS